MDIKGFNLDKTDKVVSLAKTDDGTVVMVRKVFDSRTGEALPSQVTAINKDELTDRKIALQAEIDDINAFLGEMEKAEVI